MIREVFATERTLFPTFTHDGSRFGRVQAIREFLAQATGPDDDMVEFLLDGYQVGDLDTIEPILGIIAGEEVILSQTTSL